MGWIYAITQEEKDKDMKPDEKQLEGIRDMIEEYKKLNPPQGVVDAMEGTLEELQKTARNYKFYAEMFPLDDMTDQYIRDNERIKYDDIDIEHAYKNGFLDALTMVNEIIRGHKS